MKYVKKYWFVAVFAMLIGFNVWQYIRTEHYRDVSQIQAVELSILNDSIAIYRDKEGELTYKLTSVNIDRDNLREALEVAGADIKMLKRKDIEWRNINNTLRIKLESMGSGTVSIVDTVFINHTDTVRINTFDWSNNYLSLRGTMADNKLAFDYRYQTTIDVIQSQKRRESVVSIMLSDPNASIISGNSITVKNPRPWWDRWWLFGVAGLATGVIIAK